MCVCVRVCVCMCVCVFDPVTKQHLLERDQGSGKDRVSRETKKEERKKKKKLGWGMGGTK